MVDLFFYRDPEVEEQNSLEEAEKAVPEEVPADVGFDATVTGGDWEMTGGPAAFAAPEATGITTSWDSEPATGEWAAEAAAPEIAPGW